MLNPANIYRSKRRTLAIYIDAMGDLIVKAPISMSDRRIFDFIKSKGDWIRARQAEVEKNTYINKNVVSNNTFLFLGRELVPVVSDNVKKIERRDGALLIPSKIAQEKILKRIEKWFKEQALEIITDRAAYFSHALKLSATSIITNNNKTRWGSCSRGGEIAVNWRAVMLKPDLLDYIVVHEFCHLLEFNHTREFWAVVQTILPDWKATRKQLKNMGWILQLFRTN